MTANDTEGRKPQAPRESSDWAMGLIVGGALLALFMGGNGLSLWVEARWLEANGLQAGGDIVRLTTERKIVSGARSFHSYSSDYYVTYSFVDQIGQLIEGQTQVGEAEYLSSHRGQSLTVVYAPSDPTWNRRLKHAEPEVHAYDLLMGGGGALTAIIGFIWWRAGRAGRAGRRGATPQGPQHDDGGPIMRKWAAYGAAVGLAVWLARLTDWFGTPLPPFDPLPHMVGNLVTLVTYAAGGAFILVAMRIVYALAFEMRRG